jgi:hypothetical protein
MVHGKGRSCRITIDEAGTAVVAFAANDKRVAMKFASGL